jgi:hypothetical protein
VELAPAAGRLVIDATALGLEPRETSRATPD